MTIVNDATVSQAEMSATLQEQAKRHLWLHFSRMGGYKDSDIPIIVKGDGCYVYDVNGKRYLDGLSALFCVNIGYGWTEVAEAAANQAKELAFYTNWGYAHPKSIELAARIAHLAPGDLNRVFFTNSGSEAVEAALKLVRQYHKVTGNPLKTKFIARDLAYHGATLGALAATGLPPYREPFEPFTPGGYHVPNTNLYRLATGMREEDLAESVREKILFEGPDTVAAVIMEPVQNGGGCFVPPPGYFERIREICDEFNVLLISDEVICSWGRIGEWFGSTAVNSQPDIITTAKGITSAYAPMGALIASDAVMEPFLEGNNSFLHGSTFGGHPVSSAVALANIDILEGHGLIDHVKAKQDEFRAMLGSLCDIPIVGDIRGMGYFWSVELVKDRDTKETFTADESEWLLRGFLSDELFNRGLINRCDDRGEPVLQLAPPLIADTQQFEEIEGILRPVLEEAAKRLRLK